MVFCLFYHSSLSTVNCFQHRMLLILLRFIPNQVAVTELRGGNMNTAPGLQSLWLPASGFIEESCLCSQFVLCDSLYYCQCDLFIPLPNCPREECSKKPNKFYLHLLSCSSLKANLRFILPCVMHLQSLQCLVLGRMFSRQSQELNSMDGDAPIKVSFQSVKHMYYG